jgi:hypothetical protein
VQINPGEYAPVLYIPTTAPSAADPSLQNGECLSGGKRVADRECVETNAVTVAGGGASATASAGNETEISTQAPPFELTTFAFAPSNIDGEPDLVAGSHPQDVTTTFGFSNVFQPAGVSGVSDSQTEPTENPKTVAVELPIGFLGNAQATPKCLESDLVLNSEGSEAEKTACPPASRVGSVAFSAEGHVYTGSENDAPTSIYNMEPQTGYPAEFAFAFAEKTIYMYATVVHTSSGYRLRVVAPGIPEAAGIVGASLTFFGDPGEADGLPGPHKAFLTNPADCSADQQSSGVLKAKIEADSWETPSRWVSAESEPYPQVTECDLLGFAPTLAFAPSSPADGGTTQADEPSGYDFTLKVPQSELFDERATPNLKEASVLLPPGVNISPAAGDGLEGCQETGPRGINITGPESEEVAADGQAHLSPGKCPDASTLGTVDVTTPLLADPLTGRMFLAQPKCGGGGQPACTEADATNGDLYGLYLEAAGSGVVVKLRGAASADPQTGQLRVTFAENPQLPFSELTVSLINGPRAPLANPQQCGGATTTSTLSSWATPEVPAADPSASFQVDWDGSGGACPASLPFAPGFSAGTLSPSAGAFSPFTLSFGRQDREQDLSGLTVTLAPGLLGKIAEIPRCTEGPANAGTCDAGSQIGTVNVLAGAGARPLSITGGRAYLTDGYKGAPFGLSIVVPAVAGPFNLGSVVVRARITIDSDTAAITVTSDPLPQSKDGVPFRLRSATVNVDRPTFTLNPTNCSQQSIEATVTGAEGASLRPRYPFSASGCSSLPFKPRFNVATSGKTSKAKGASLNVKLTFPSANSSGSNSVNGPGNSRANVAYVKVQLPKALPARLTTLQRACTARVFDSNPANCPPESIVAHAKAVTPILSVPLEGPAYFVSHGGEAFPQLIVLLQGEGIVIDLVGDTNIKNGITTSTFAHVPDAAVSSFELNLPQGQYSALSTDGSLCQQKLVMPTEFKAQNGAQLKQNTQIEVEGCPNALSVVAKQVKNGTITLRVAVPARGTLRASGKGLSSAAKPAGGRETVVVTLHQKRRGKLKTGIKLRFTPAKGKTLSKSLAVKLSR